MQTSASAVYSQPEVAQMLSDENKRFPGCCSTAQVSHTDRSGGSCTAELLDDGLWLLCAEGRGQLIISGCSSALRVRIDNPASNSAFARLHLGFVSVTSVLVSLNNNAFTFWHFEQCQQSI